MVEFVCNAEGCANQGVVYPMDTKDTVAECGGCGVKLEGTAHE